MKRAKDLFERVASFENLWLASRRARRGKRFQSDVAAFEFELEPNLIGLHDELRSMAWHPGPYRQFFVREPKKRLISAAPYRDRVVHHALMNVLEPIHDRGFVFDSLVLLADDGASAGPALAGLDAGDSQLVSQQGIEPDLH